MPTLRHNFDGGPSGTQLTVANSGQVPGNDAFQVVSPTGSGCIVQYQDAALLGRPTAEFVLKTETGAVATDNAVIWNTAMGSQSQVWWRQYIMLTELPVTSGASLNMPIFECDNGAVYCALVYVRRTTGLLAFVDDPTPVVNIATTNALPLNAWARIECRIQFSTTVGNFDLNLYLEPDSDTPTETISGTGLNLSAATANSFCFGSAFSDSFKALTYFSGLELNNTGWPGPAPWRSGKGAPNRNLSNCVAIHTAGE
jgi:hypothetical protein